MNDSTPMFSAHARPNRAVRRFALSRRRQRKAQALILAVLVMLMVAVLSAGFLLVVSGNLNQTARITDKTRAVESARSGLRFVNDQLTYSQLGENWRPGFVTGTNDVKLLGYGESRMPQSSDPAFDLYYSSVDKAQNWAGLFAKFPDPLAPRSDAPQYLARVQRIASTNPTNDSNITDPTDPDSQDPSKIGMLKITVIGLSNDDPAAFSKVVAYKGGQSSPFDRVMWAVTNWDFKNNVVPVGQTDSANASTTTQLNLTNVQGRFPSVPFTVMVGNPDPSGTSQLASAVVAGVAPTATGVQLTLASALGSAPNGNTRVEVAAQLGSSLGMRGAGLMPPANQSAINFANDNTYTNTNITLSQPAPSSATAAQSGSLFVNGSVVFDGDLKLPDLVPQSSTASYYSSIRATGLMLSDLTSHNVAVTVRDSSGNQTGADGSTTPSQFTSTSNAVDLLKVSGGSAIAQTTADPVFADGLNRLLGNPDTTRQTKPVTPPDISSSAGAGRYRQLTRDSKVNLNSQVPALPNNTPDSASNYGYGQGIYINNPSDRERTSAGGTLRDMTQAQLIKMWLSRQADGTPDTSTSYDRTGPVEAVSDNTKSLEERHLRGWVGPDEFHARGALVELIPGATATNPPQIAITLDERQDGDSTLTPAITSVATDAVNSKSWKDTSGNTLPGVYRKVFPWPANGLIFAEGNIRIRGEVTGAPRSLTVVSENNIYVDGELRADTTSANAQKVLLLARKNVVANPTALISRVEGATLYQSVDPTTKKVVTVNDSSQFQKGDWISISSATPAINRVVDVDPVANTLTLAQAITPPTVTNPVVSALSDPLDDANAHIRTDWEKISNFNQVVQRRFPSNTGTLRLAFLHSAEQRTALRITVPNNTAKANLTGKAAGAGAQILVNSATKELAIDQDQGTDKFDLKAETTLSSFVSTSNSQSPVGSYTPTWNYQFGVLPTASVGNDYSNIAPTSLAGVGNRKPFTITGGTYPWVQDLKGVNPPSGTDVPVATSVTPTFGGLNSLGQLNPTTLSTDFSGSSFQPVSNLGFSAEPTAVNEDVLTSDTSFYVPDAAPNTPQTFALDSRVIAPPSGATGGQTFALTLSRAGGVAPAGFEFDPVANSTKTNKMPYYRMGGMKLENLTPPTTGTAFAGVQPVPVNINAFVYAQQGSWFVIPAPLFDAAAKNGDDANRDGTNTDGSDPVNAYRFARYNYQINFTGAIAENQTAIVNSIPGTPVVGAVQAWSDSWANVTTDASTLQKQNAGVLYTFDPSYAAGQLANDPGFVMPQSEELTYVE